MPRRCAVLFLIAGVCVAQDAAASLSARPETLIPERWAEGLTWAARPVRAPVAPASVRGRSPYVPEGVPQVTGEVEVGPDRAAAFWLSALEVARVSGGSGALRFSRVSGGSASLAVEEQGVSAAGGRAYLTEPMGQGSVWLVTSEKPARVQVERPEPLSGALTDEAVRAALLAWVEGGREQAPLPFAADVRAQLAVEAELGAALSEGLAAKSPLADAVLAWRKASALKAWMLTQPLHAKTFRIWRKEGPGEAVALEGITQPYFRPPAGVGAWTIEAEGPGVLELEVRPLLGSGATRPVRLEVLVNAEVVGAREVMPRAASQRPEEETALPVERPHRMLGSGERVGVEESLRVPLRSGRHTYRVQWRGGSVLLRGAVAQRRPWFGEAVAKEAHWEDLAARAWKRVEGDSSPRAAVLRAKLSALDPRFAPPELVPASLASLTPELRATAALEASRSTREAKARLPLAMAAAKAVQDAAGSKRSSLGWSLRLGAARQLLELGRAEEAQRLLSHAPAFPESGWLAAEAAELVGRFPAGDASRSRELAALELAWRREPLSREIRERYQAAWWRASQWRLLGPTRSDGEALARAQRWLDLEPLEAGEAAEGALEALVPGRMLAVKSAPASAQVPALMRVLLVPRADGSAPVTLHVGHKAFPLLPLTAVEPVEIALPAGEHAVRLEAEAGTRAYLALQGTGGGTLRQEPVPGTAEAAYVRTQWPVQREVRFKIPDPQLSSPVRVQLRSSEGKRIAVRMHTDKGFARRLVLEPGEASPLHYSLHGAHGTARPAASGVFFLPPHAREVWFEPEDAASSVFASISVRRSLADAPVPGPALVADPGQTPSIDALLALSRKLQDSPQAADLLLSRAELLSGAEEGFARADVSALMRRDGTLTPAQAQRLQALLVRLASGDSEDIRFARALTEPTLIAPAFPVLGSEAPPELRAAAALARAGKVPDALARLASSKDVGARYLHARLLAVKGDFEPAALELVRLYQKTQSPQVGVEALAHLERLQADPKVWSDGIAPLGAALSTELTGWAEVPTITRVRRAALPWTRWELLRDAEKSAGRMEAVEPGGSLDADDAVEKALLAPPWPLDEVRMIKAERSSVLELTSAGRQRLGAQVLCNALRTSAAPLEACRFALRVDGAVVAEETVAPGKTATLTASLSAPGRHQLEVLLGKSDARALGLVRFVTVDPKTGPRALAAHRPLPLMRSRPGQPVVMTVLGPTALRVSARSLAPAGASELQVEMAPVKPGREVESQRLQVAVPADVDVRLRGTPAPVSMQGEAILLLAERGAHRIRFEPKDGELLLHVQSALGASPVAAAREPLLADAAPAAEPLPWPASPGPLGLLPGAEQEAWSHRGLGMISTEMAFRQEDVQEGEILNRPLRSGMELSLAYRQELLERRAWFRIQPEVRTPFASRPVIGSSAAFYMSRLPLDLRVSLWGGFHGQQLEGATRWAARGRATVDRWVGLTPDLALIPSLGFTVESFRGSDAVEASRFDRMVYWRYGEQHARRLRPQLALRWQPFQDHVGSLSTFATSNADLRTLDNVNGALRWAALVGPLPRTRVELGYGLSYRAQDANRPEPYFRHQLDGRLDWTMWTRGQNRFLLFAEDRALFPQVFGLQNIVSLGVRWDWTGGRGLRDLIPFEEQFEDLLDPRRSAE